MLFTAGQAFSGSLTRLAHPPTVGARLLYVLGYTFLGGLIGVGGYLGINHPMVQRARPLRWVAMALLVWLLLTIVTLAFRQFDSGPALMHVTRPSFILSTSGLAVLIGGLYAFGLLFRTVGPERVYLSPAEYAALTPAEQARLQPVSDDKAPPPPQPGTGS